LRQNRPEFSILLIIITAVISLLLILSALTEPLNTLSQKLSAHGVELSYFKVALKALGIGYVTSFCADICRDAGQTSLASLSEIAGKCGIFILSLPLVFNIIDLALGFIK
jgi:stage III sporulation protein AD